MAGFNWEDLNPVHDLRSLGKAVGLPDNWTGPTGLFGGKSSTPSAPANAAPGTAWGEPAQPSSTQSPTSYIQQYLAATGAPSGVTGQQIYNYLAAADPQALKNPDDLQSALNKYAQYAGWSVPGGSGSTSASVIDPLAVQAFFQQTIAPLLNQTAALEGQTANQLRNQPTVPGLPASYAAVVQQGQQTQANDMDALQQATLAAGATQPQVSMLNQMLGLAQKASLQDYYRQLEAGIGGTTTAPPTGGF